jgi:hypothetical protein
MAPINKPGKYGTSIPRDHTGLTTDRLRLVEATVTVVLLRPDRLAGAAQAGSLQAAWAGLEPQAAAQGPGLRPLRPLSQCRPAQGQPEPE